MAKKRFQISKREFINLSINVAVMIAVLIVVYFCTSLIEWSLKLSDWSAVGKYFVIVASYSIIKSLHNYGR
jgi:hypothetical protein